MNSVVRALTILTVLTFLWQIIAEKGTRRHIIGGVFVGVSAIMVVIINTILIATSRGLIWDFPFLLHIGFGVCFLFAWLLTVFSGYLRMQGRIKKMSHRRLAWAQGIFLLLTALTGIGIPYLRTLIAGI